MSTINILGDIGASVKAEDVIKEIQTVTDDKIKVIIASPGGSAFQGLMIFDALKASGKEITTVILGLGASAASVVFMAGSKREMGEGALIMVHNSRVNFSGTAAEMRDKIESLDAIDGRMKSILTGVSGLSEESATELLRKDSFMNLDDAKAAGIATDSITDDIAAEINYCPASDRFYSTNENKKEAFKMPKSEEKDKSEKGLLNHIAEFFIGKKDPQAAEETEEKPKDPVKDPEAAEDEGEEKRPPEKPEDDGDEMKALKAENDKLKQQLADAQAKAKIDNDQEDSKAGVILGALKDDKITMHEANNLSVKSFDDVQSFIKDKDPNETGLGKPKTEPKTEIKASHFEEYKALDGEEATAYFSEHKDEIIKSMEK